MVEAHVLKPKGTGQRDGMILVQGALKLRK